VREGGTAIAEEALLAPEHPVWVDFARSMAPLAALSAGLLANLLDAPAGTPWKVLDIAAGHGMFGIALAQENPNARIVALDWANVLAVAEEAATLRLVLLAITPGGDAYTFSEYEGMFRRAGFARSELRDLPPSIQRVVISYR